MAFLCSLNSSPRNFISGSGRPEDMSAVPLGEGGVVAAAGAVWDLGRKTTKAVKSAKTVRAPYHFQSRRMFMAASYRRGVRP